MLETSILTQVRGIFQQLEARYTFHYYRCYHASYYFVQTVRFGVSGIFFLFFWGWYRLFFDNLCYFPVSAFQ